MKYAKSFKDLEVYQLAREVARGIFILTKDFPPEERYSLTDQMRRSSRSIGAQIAESWGKRRYENHFILKLTDADSEQFETQHWLEVALENGYIDKSTKNELTNKCESIGKMLNSMMDKASLFCQKK
ncbi:MAG: four helix bundle protein [bacterium]